MFLSVYNLLCLILLNASLKGLGWHLSTLMSTYASEDPCRSSEDELGESLMLTSLPHPQLFPVSGVTAPRGHC